MRIYAIVAGRTYALNDAADNLIEPPISLDVETEELISSASSYCRWKSDDGLGMAPMHRLSERGPMQHGDTDRGYRLDPRIVRLIFMILQNTQAAYETARTDLINIFKPSNSPIILRLDFEARTYYLDCYYVGGPMSMPSADRFNTAQNLIVELKANDPTFYDPSGEAVSFAIGAGGDTMLVPTVIPMTIGASAINATQSIANDGSVEAYPNIRITGPIISPIITNNSTGELLSFSGGTIGAGAYYDINLSYGNKTVTDNGGISQISKLTDASDLVGWHFGCHPEVEDGVNSITVTGSGCTESTKLDFAWYNRYIGI